MKRLEAWVDYEGPDGGTVRVLWAWVDHPLGATRIPVAVEFGLFTSDSERQALTAWLDRVRIDRTVSVSAPGQGRAALALEDQQEDPQGPSSLPF